MYEGGREARPSLRVACLAFAGLLASAGCGSGAASDTVEEPQDHRQEAPLLGSEHAGYKAAHCDSCHPPPISGHAADSSPACAVCHGGNGACDPNGPYGTRAHTPNDACTECHMATEGHGYPRDADCAACHFAAFGLDEGCGAPPEEPASELRPESELRSGCYGWPGAEFTTENFASVGLGLTTGEAAVDFTLRTPEGTPISLSDLLRTRPVVLVTGGFT